MTAKVYDNKGRWRHYNTAFRMSKEEHDELNKRVELSGLTKQDYMIKRTLEKEIIVVGNMRTFRALRNQIVELRSTLEKCMKGNENIDNEIIDRIKYI